jgi:hypothetical protein
VITLNQLLVGDKRKILDTMHFGQVCWSCQPLLCQYLLGTGLSDVTYLEADSYFYTSPEVLFEEIGERSVSLVPHNYAPQHDQTATSGVYCVQFNMFRNDEHGHRFLQQWQDACMQYDKRLPEKYPGQTCLDSWPRQSSAVCVIKNPGAGVAPWNQSLFKFSERDGVPLVDGRPIVFYHFHQLSFIDDTAFHTSTYRLDRKLIDMVYRPYAERLVALRRELQARLPGFNHCKRYKAPPTLLQALSSRKLGTWKELLRHFRDLPAQRANIVHVD